MSGKDQIKSIAEAVEYIGGKSFKKFNNERTNSGSLLTYVDVKVTDNQLQEINSKIEQFRGRAVVNNKNLEVRVYYAAE